MTKALKSRIDLVRSPFNFTKPCLFTWTLFFVSHDIKRPQLEKKSIVVARQGFHSSCKYPFVRYE
jgi:hypothetical protein